jgi:hypothetical protein
MRSGAASILRWTATIEDDTGDNDAHRVFVPSMMGVGILVSLGVLASDALRALTPSRTRARAQAGRRRRAEALVAPLAEAVGLPPPLTASNRRRLRARWVYVALFVGGVSLSLYVGIGSTANYLRTGGYLEGVVWVEAIAVASSLFFMALGVLALAIAWSYPVVPRRIRRIVDRTPLGARKV